MSELSTYMYLSPLASHETVKYSGSLVGDTANVAGGDEPSRNPGHRNKYLIRNRWPGARFRLACRQFSLSPGLQIEWGPLEAKVFVFFRIEFEWVIIIGFRGVTTNRILYR